MFYSTEYSEIFIQQSLEKYKISEESIGEENNLHIMAELEEISFSYRLSKIDTIAMIGPSENLEVADYYRYTE